MRHEPTDGPMRARDDFAGESTPAREEMVRLAESFRAQDGRDESGETPGARTAPPSDNVQPSSESLTSSPTAFLSSVAVALTDERHAFLDALRRAAEADISPVMRSGFERAGNLASDESAALERLVDVVVDEARPSHAAQICAALAARTVAQSLPNVEGRVPAKDGEALLAAWLETARAMAAARGSAGLRRLLPAAQLLARRSSERGEQATQIAATMRRIAARIVVELSLDRAFGGASERQCPQRVLSAKSSPRGMVVRSPAEMTLDAR